MKKNNAILAQQTATGKRDFVAEWEADMEQMRKAIAEVENKSTFDQLKADFCNAYAVDPTSEHCADTATRLASVFAKSVVKKLIDPRRADAHAEQVSDSGCNPVMIALRGDILTAEHDLTAERTRMNNERFLEIDADGNYKQTAKATEQMIVSLLGDGYDLVQEAVCALYEQAAEHSGAPTEDGKTWLDVPYTVRRLSKRVYIQLEDSAAYADIETTAATEVFRAVRRIVQTSKAVTADPKSKYVYIDNNDSETLDTIYYRCGKYADIGGYDINGNYTANIETAKDYETMLRELDLTKRQKQIVGLRMQGYGAKAIGAYLGINPQNVKVILKRLQASCIVRGYFQNPEND